LRLRASARANNFFAYARGGHRHEAEIAEFLRREGVGEDGSAVRLLTHSAPLVRGIHATAYLHLSAPLENLDGLLRDAWAGRPFVRLLEEPPEIEAVAGTNFAHLHGVVRPGGREAIVDCAIDNLVKGASGQAVQCANAVLGLDEATGLTTIGLYP